MTKYELLNILYAERNRVEKNFARPGWSLWAIGASIASLGWLAWSYAEQCHHWKYAIMTFYLLYTAGEMIEILLSPYRTNLQIPIWVNGYSRNFIKIILKILACIGLSIFQFFFIPHDFCLFLYWFTLGFNVGHLVALFEMIISGKGYVMYQKQKEYIWLLSFIFLPSLIFVTCYMLQLQHDSIAIRLGTIVYTIYMLLSLIPIGRKKLFLKIDRLITKVLYEVNDVDPKEVLRELELYIIGLRYGKYLSRENMIEFVSQIRKLLECTHKLISCIEARNTLELDTAIQAGQAQYEELNKWMSERLHEIQSVYDEDNIDMSLTPILSASKVGVKAMEYWTRVVTILKNNDIPQCSKLFRTAYDETIGLPEIQKILDDETLWEVDFGERNIE